MTHLGSQRSDVTSADGTRIAVFESGYAGGPVLVAVHGYPDNHTVWDGFAAELGDRYRVVTYDVRGAGDSDKPRGRAAYRAERLVEDLAAVLDSVSPVTPVHLVGHDWGSIQSWVAVTSPRFADRIASFTSISGPHLDYVGVWMRDRSHPSASARQFLKSWYIVAFQLPGLPERILRLTSVDRGIARAELKGRLKGSQADPVVRSEADKVNGVNLYRANMPARLARPRPRPTKIPVQVLALDEDAFVSVPLASESPVPFVEDLTVTDVPGSHWMVTARPDLVAMHVHGFIESKRPAPPATKSRRRSSASG